MYPREYTWWLILFIIIFSNTFPPVFSRLMGRNFDTHHFLLARVLLSVLSLLFSTSLEKFLSLGIRCRLLLCSGVGFLPASYTLRLVCHLPLALFSLPCCVCKGITSIPTRGKIRILIYSDMINVPVSMYVQSKAERS